MTIIDKNGERSVCDRCHRVNVKFKRGDVCVDCRAAAWAEEVRYRREMKAEMAWVAAYQGELRRIDVGEVNPQCMECGGEGNRPNYASAVASGKKYVCYKCRCGRKAAV